ncbi:coiled-coil domain-containing protein 28B-like [Babylonia areolata]|uniref:coiled-coil domain-containing protein 28B-like n=1 Tax=Babylonia areolata TaxID=304850 RepID=UPI003FCF43A2
MSNAEAASAAPSQLPGHGREKRRGAVVGRRRSSMRDSSHPPAQEKPGAKKGKGGSGSGGGGVKRLTKEHSFLTDVADVRAMEQGLLQLLGDFHSGKLRAFNEGATFEKMDQVREQQERLARLHFELDIQQDLHRLGTEEARTTANENLSKLVDQLHNLSMSIQTLQPGATEKEEKKSKH